MRLGKLADALWSTTRISHLESCNKIREIDSLICVCNTAARLPSCLRACYKEKIHECKEQHGSFPGKHRIWEFIQTHADGANNELYKDKDDKADMRKAPSFPSYQDKQSNRQAVGLATITSRSSSVSNDRKGISCSMCFGLHNLSMCVNLRDMDVVTRLETTRRLQCCCYLCLRVHHMVEVTVWYQWMPKKTCWVATS